MLPPYIIDRDKQQETENRIQLELPDYRLEYEEWRRKKEKEQSDEEESTIVIIDIY